MRKVDEEGAQDGADHARHDGHDQPEARLVERVRVDDAVGHVDEQRRQHVRQDRDQGHDAQVRVRVPAGQDAVQPAERVGGRVKVERRLLRLAGGGGRCAAAGYFVRAGPGDTCSEHDRVSLVNR